MLGRGYYNSLDNIFKRLGLWENCVLCLDFADERCMPVGSNGVYYDLSPSQIILRDSPTVPATKTNNDALGIPTHLRASTANRHLFADDDAVGTFFNETENQLAFKWQSVGMDGAKWSTFLITSTPLLGTAAQLARYGYQDFSTVTITKTAGEVYNMAMSAADNMNDTNHASTVVLTADEWAFGLLTCSEGLPLNTWRAQSTVETDAADPYETPGWLGDGPIMLASTINSTPTVTAGVNPTRHLMHAFWADRIISTEEMARLHAEIKAIRITDLE